MSMKIQTKLVHMEKREEGGVYDCWVYMTGQEEERGTWWEGQIYCW